MLKKIIKQIVHYTRIGLGFFPITLGGVILCVIAFVAWKYEVTEHANQVLFAALAAIAGALGLMLFFTFITAALVAGLTWKANRGKKWEGEFEAEQEIETGYSVFYPFYLPFVEISATTSEEFGIHSRWKRQGSWLMEYITFEQRGEFREIRRKFNIGDIFAMTSMQWSTKQEVQVIVLPAPGILDTVTMVKTASGEGYSHPAGDPKGELVEMRRYQAGDPLRLVLWRVFARSRKLLVRTQENAVEEQKDLFIYFVASKGDDGTASLAREFLKNSDGLASNYLFAADGSEKLSDNVKDGMNDLVHSVKHRDQGGETLSKLSLQIPDKVRSNPFFLVPCVDGDWLDKMPNYMTLFPTPPVFIVGMDGDFKDALKAKKKKKRKGIFFERDIEENKLVSFRKVYEKLSKLGEVRAIYRKDGKLITSDEMEALQRL